MRKESFYQWLVRKLPRKLIYFSAIHLGAETTTGKYGDTIVPELTFMDAIKRFADDNNLN